jgi:hypothetical protein
MSGIYISIVLTMVAVTAGAFAVVWRYVKNHDHIALRRINLILGVFFTLMGLLVSIDVTTLTFQFNDYVDDTVVRDSNQESCISQTIVTIRQWGQARLEADEAERQRDLALVPLFGQLQRGEPVDPKIASDVAQSFIDVEVARKHLAFVWSRYPLPDC